MGVTSFLLPGYGFRSGQPSELTNKRFFLAASLSYFVQRLFSNAFLDPFMPPDLGSDSWKEFFFFSRQRLLYSTSERPLVFLDVYAYPSFCTSTLVACSASAVRCLVLLDCFAFLDVRRVYEPF